MLHILKSAPRSVVMKVHEIKELQRNMHMFDLNDAIIRREKKKKAIKLFIRRLCIGTRVTLQNKPLQYHS